VTRFVLATTNAHKAREIAEVMAAAGYVAQLEPRPGHVPEVDETGMTFEDNARLKAIAVSRATGMPAVADDSGLEVAALGGAPGVRSARYAGEHASDRDNLEKLLQQLAGVPDERRGARFACVAVARFPDGREVAAFGSVDGRIVDEPRGREGFGYDPVFVPDEGDGRTFAEMGASEKNDLSHRGRAFRTLADGLRMVEALEDES
jgi:XTP/dITP diphosphohydrolase